MAEEQADEASPAPAALARSASLQLEAVITAIKHDSLALLEQTLQQTQGSVLLSTDTIGRNALHYASAVGSEQACELLADWLLRLRAAAPPQAAPSTRDGDAVRSVLLQRDSNQDTPLHLATRLGAAMKVRKGARSARLCAHEWQRNC